MNQINNIKIASSIFSFLCIWQQTYTYSLPKKGTVECVHSYQCIGVQLCQDGLCKIATVSSKQTCPHVFKNKCSSDTECVCPEQSMICEDNECVYSKHHNIPKTKFCSKHADCDGVNVCEDKKCRPIKNWDELKMLRASSDCASNTDCSAGEECSKNLCMKNKRDAKITIECQKDSDCSSGYNCFEKTCISNLFERRVLEETLCLVKASKKFCISNKDCDGCGHHLLSCQRFKCKLQKPTSKS
ncbi:uncharacterized protein DDB_G0272512-like [Hydractinia symbiolongicarpus]|uniref:uncharacterized protein DDB_G0272512-like n=1 Tax=Hydractinia symbiolongicarpus TaxID=13093 RepID=UPI00254BDA3D|nr:uncharacterized protein DDB_G0272512-like [Hydractinia symbiolongicarpus]